MKKFILLSEVLLLTIATIIFSPMLGATILALLSLEAIWFVNLIVGFIVLGFLIPLTILILGSFLSLFNKQP